MPTIYGPSADIDPGQAYLFQCVDSGLFAASRDPTGPRPSHRSTRPPTQSRRAWHTPRWQRAGACRSPCWRRRWRPSSCAGRSVPCVTPQSAPARRFHGGGISGPAAPGADRRQHRPRQRRHVRSRLQGAQARHRTFAAANASEIRAPSQSFSGDQFLPQRFSDGLGSVANAELGLRLFQVASNGLRADIERLGNLRRLRAHRRQSQDGKFPGR